MQLLTFASLAFLLACAFQNTATGQQNAPSPQVYELPPEGQPTTFVNLQGIHFDPLTAIDIYFDSTHLASTTTGKNGSFGNGIITATGATFTRLQVPSTAQPGQHTITAKERVGQNSVQQSFVVRTDWPKYHFDLSNTGLNPYENVLSPDTVGNLALDWKYTAQGINLSLPAVVNGVVYVGSQDHNVYALNASTGVLIWKYLTGNEVVTSPTVVNGVVYVVSIDGYLFALNASTGALLWKYTAGDITSSPTVANGVVYVGAANDAEVYALDAVTGALIWKYGTRGYVFYFAPAMAKGVVYFSDSGGVYALNAMTGALIWKFTPGDHFGTSPAVANGVVYIGDDAPGFYALDASTGALLWWFITDGNYGDNCYDPTVANGLLYINCYSYSHYVVNVLDVATQLYVWEGPFGSQVPVVANGVAYVGSYALNASTGAVLWSWPGSLYSATVSNGMVYAGADDGIYAFHLPSQEMSEKFSPPQRPDPARLTPDWSLQRNTLVMPSKK